MTLRRPVPPASQQQMSDVGQHVDPAVLLAGTTAFVVGGWPHLATTARRTLEKIRPAHVYVSDRRCDSLSDVDCRLYETARYRCTDHHLGGCKYNGEDIRISGHTQHNNTNITLDMRGC